jgi:hypothetical protein
MPIDTEYIFIFKNSSNVQTHKKILFPCGPISNASLGAGEEGSCHLKIVSLAGRRSQFLSLCKVLHYLV